MTITMSFGRRVLATAIGLAGLCSTIVRAASVSSPATVASGGDSKSSDDAQFWMAIPFYWLFATLIARLNREIVIAFVLCSAITARLLYTRRVQKWVHIKLGQLVPQVPVRGRAVVDHALSDDTSPTSEATHDVIIIGAGVVGGALATVLARQGKRVLVVEASMAEPDRIVGELLQPYGIEKLKSVGLEDALEGFDAQPTNGYGILLNGKKMEVMYEPAVKNSTSPLPQGRGFHNGKLLMKLRHIARQETNVTLLEANVSHIMRTGKRITGIRYTANGVDSCARAHLVVVADGCFSKFRGLLHDAQWERTSSFVGLIMRDCTMPVPGAGHVILAKPSPVIFYPITHNEVRMLIDFPNDPQGRPTVPQSLAAMKAYLTGEFASQIPACMLQSYLDAVNVATNFPMMPNRKLDARPNLDYENVVLLGDALNMRHPTTGGGMSVGFSDMVAFSDAVKNIELSNHSALNKSIHQFYATHGKEVQVINILADALYGVFKSEGFPELQFGCFQYLAKKGDYARGPVLFLSGVNRQQYFLLYHFFAVGIYAMFLTICPSYFTKRDPETDKPRLAVDMPLPYIPSPWLIGRMWKALQVFRMCLRIILPLMVRENNWLPLSVAVIGIRTAFWVW